MSRTLSTVVPVFAVLAVALVGAAQAGVLPTPDGPAAGAATERDAAQRGLDFLAQATVAWQTQHRCYGCHVQAHALEAMAVGVAHQYEVKDPQLRTVIAGLTTIDGGTRTPGGLRYAHGGTLVAPSQGFGGAAIARFDSLVDGSLTDDLLTVAAQLETIQRDDGSVIDPGGWVNAPVGIAGTEQMTYQAIATWRQAYERTADDRWMAASAQAEDHLRGRVNAFTGAEETQPLNYALLGLVHAGATPSEAPVARTLQALLARQNEDGGWGQTVGAASDALATGQTLYTLRKLGLTEADAAVDKGLGWLVQHQLPGGGWSHEGEAKAEAMWAVLGMVSVDLMTLTLSGVEDGQHVSGTLQLRAHAATNDETPVSSLELRVDDRLVVSAAADTLVHAWDTAELDDGRHIIEVRALNARGKTSRRRLEVFAGDWFLTRVATRWDDGGTTVSARDLAPSGRAHTVRLTVKKDEGGQPGATLHATEEPGRQGPVQFWLDGAAEALKGQRLHAVLEVVEAGRVVQTETTTFVHADPQWKQDRYAGVQGRIDLAAGEEVVNTLVELVDEAGNVVARSVTTDQGQYRFDDLDEGKYRVRVSKKGWKTKEAEVEARAAAPAAAADVTME